jgi:MFS family permease
MERKNWHSFMLIWIGQVISLFGSGLTNFGLGVWVYQQTGSATAFTLIYVCGAVPALLLAPFAGVLVDRWNRRDALLLSNLGAAFGTIVLVALVALHRLAVWHVYGIVAFGTVFLALQFPAYGAAVTLLVPKQHLGRASGMVQLGASAARIVAPLLAGVLMPIIRLEGLVLVDIVTFLIGAVTLLLAQVPRPEASAVGRASQAGGILRDAAFGWTYLRSRPALLSLLAFFAVLNLFFAMSQVLVTPLVLSEAGAPQLGLVLSAGSCGALAGGLLMSTLGGPSKRVLGILGFSPLLGLAMALIGVSSWVPVVAAGSFLAFLVVPVINGSDQALWQSKVEPDLQGRVFAMRQLLSQFSAPLAYLASGPLADRVFAPLLVPGGRLAGSLGPLLGVGSGRGIGLQFLLMGTLLTLAALVGLAYPRLRHLDESVPDVAAAPAATAPAEPAEA